MVSPPRPRRSPGLRTHPPRPALEALEDRTLLDGSVKLSNGLLAITGTTGNDTVVVQETPGPNNQPNQIAVTLNGQTSTFKVTLVKQIQAQLLGGDDSFTLDHSSVPVAPPVSVDGGTGTNAVTVNGTAGADSFTVTATTVGLAGAGTLTYSNVKFVNVNGLGGDDTVSAVSIGADTTFDGGAGKLTVSVGTLAGTLLATGGSITGTTISSIAPRGVLQATEDATAPGSGVISGLSIGTNSGSVLAGSLGSVLPDGSVSGVSFGLNEGLVQAAGQGTATGVSIGTNTGTFNAVEDSKPGSGTMSSTTIGTNSGTVSAGSISGMSVTSNSGSITAAGQGTTTGVTIGTNSGSLTAVEKPGETGSGTMSSTSIGTNSGTVSAGSISGMSVTSNSGSITAAGQGTTTGVSIGTNSGSLTAVEKPGETGSGTMSSTTIGTNSGTVSAGTISGMSVTSNSGSITAAGQGAATSVSIGTLAGTLAALPDTTPGSGRLSDVSIGTLLPTGRLLAGHFNVVRAQHASPTVNFIELAAVGTGTVVNVTRTLSVTPHNGGAVPDYGFYYDGSVTGADPRVVVQVAINTTSPVSFDFGATTSTTTNPGAGFDLAGLYSVDQNGNRNVPTGVHNVVVGGDLLNAVPDGAVAFFNLPNTTGGVQLPKDSIAVAAAGNLPAASVVAQTVSSMAAGSFAGVSADVAAAGDALVPLAAGTTLVQANDTYLLFVSEAEHVAQFLNTNTGSGSFDVKGVLFADQQADNSPVTATETVQASGSSSTIQTVDFTGQGASLKTAQPITQLIKVEAGGSLGDLTESAPQGLSARVSAPVIIGSILVPKGAISNTIEATAGDIGRAFTDASGNITGVTTIVTGGGGLTSTGKILAKGSLVSQLSLQSGLDGVVAADGDIGVIQTVGGVAKINPDLSLTRFGGITVSTGGLNGQVIALGNVFGDISITGGLSGRIAVRGNPGEFGLDPSFRYGLLGNVSVSGGISTTGAIVTDGLIGDDGANNITNDTSGTHLTTSGTDKGILAAGKDINFGATGSLNQAGLFENASASNVAVIDAIFTNNNVTLDVTHRNDQGQLDQLNLIIQDLLALTVSKGNLTGTTP